MDASTTRLDLAHAAPFGVGELLVEPALRVVRSETSSKIVEPRVMQLFVALAEADGGVLSREDLIQQCWGGVVVGDNAIHRAVSKARTIAATIGHGSFKIETVRGVGYRLVERNSNHGGNQKIPVAPNWGRLSRRSILGGSLVAAAGLGLPALLGSSGDGRPDALANEFYRRGEIQLREEIAPAALEAVENFRNALRTSPTFALAWAGLATAHWQLMFESDGAQLDRLAALSVSAAKRALTLDPSLAAAETTLELVPPFFRRWHQLQPKLQKLSNEHPNEWLIARALGWLAAETGDQKEAVAQFARCLEIEPLLPRAAVDLGNALWAADRLTEAEEVLTSAQETWPTNYVVWDGLISYLAYSGDIAAAKRQLTADRSKLPYWLTDSALARRHKLVLALEAGAAEHHVTAAIDDYVGVTREVPLALTATSLLLARKGRRDELFDLLDGFFLDRGSYVKKRHRYSRRPTSFLFLPPMRDVHSDDRFGKLLSELGLA